MRKTTLLTLLTLLFGVSFSAHAQYGVKTSTLDGAKYEYYIVRPQGGKYVTATKGGTAAVELCTNNISGTTKVNFIFVEKEKNGTTYLALYATNILTDGSGNYINVPVTIATDDNTKAVAETTPYKLTPSGTPALFYIETIAAGSTSGNKDVKQNEIYTQLRLAYDSNDLTYTTTGNTGQNNNYWGASNNEYIRYYLVNGNTAQPGPFFMWKFAPVDKTAPQMAFSSTTEGTLGTYSSPVDFAIPDGVKAYKVSSTTPKDNTISLEEITGTVPAGKGIIIEQHGSESVYDVAYSSETSSVDETNLQATTAASSSITSTSTDLKTVSTYNVASKQSTTGPIWVENSDNIYGLSGGTFYHLTNSDDASASYITLPPYKAYLVTTAANATTLKLQFPDGNTTSINAINADSNSNAAVYDLSGRRVNKTAKGSLYIQNGKKFIAE